jgi:hypothetical protein
MSGRIVKRHLNTFLTRIRQVYDGVQYLWFLEFQKRGAPHIHIIWSLDAPQERERLWFADTWARICCDGNNWSYTQIECYKGRFVGGSVLYTQDAVKFNHLRERHWEGVRVKDGCVRYVCKYALKPNQKVVPKAYGDVGRFWGTSRGMTNGDGEMVYGSESQVRRFLESKGRDMSNYEVLPKLIVY